MGMEWPQIDSMKKFQRFGFVVPPIMLISALLFFIPRNLDFYGTYPTLKWGNVFIASSVWLGGAWITTFIAVKVCVRIEIDNHTQTTLSAQVHIKQKKHGKNHFSETFLKPLPRLEGIKGFLVFFYYSYRKWLKPWRFYVLLWICWAIVWDTALPGFVYVPNLFTWHQWMFAPAVARFVVDAHL